MKLLGVSSSPRAVSASAEIIRCTFSRARNGKVRHKMCLSTSAASCRRRTHKSRAFLLYLKCAVVLVSFVMV